MEKLLTVENFSLAGLQKEAPTLAGAYIGVSLEAYRNLIIQMLNKSLIQKGLGIDVFTHES